MTNETNAIKTEVVSISTGELIDFPVIFLQTSPLEIVSNLEEEAVTLANRFASQRVEVTLENYKFAKKNATALNKLSEDVALMIKEKIENPENALKQIKVAAKNLIAIIQAERNYLMEGYEEVYLKEFRKKLKELVLIDIEKQYLEHGLEVEYRTITEEQVSNVAKVQGNAGFQNDRKGDFNFLYINKQGRGEIDKLINNCLKFKQDRINRIQALEIANLKAGLEENFRITLEDVTPFLDDVEPNFTNKLKAKIQQAFTKQEAIRLENERKLNAEMERLKKEAEERENAIKMEAEAEAKKELQIAQEKHEAELKSAKIEVVEAVNQIQEVKAENEGLYEKYGTLLKRVDTPKHYEPINAIQIPTLNAEPVKQPVRRKYRMELIISEEEIEKARKLCISQGWASPKFTQIP